MSTIKLYICRYYRLDIQGVEAFQTEIAFIDSLGTEEKPNAYKRFKTYADSIHTVASQRTKVIYLS